MQRTENDMVIISCDFTGLDWDEKMSMIEGHRGAVLSLEALRQAIEQATDADAAVECTMCLRTIDPPQRIWRPTDPPATANADAVICWDCIQQADKAFAADADSDWTRKIRPDERWR